MKAPVALTQEIRSAPKTVRQPTDYAQYVEYIKWALAHDNGALVPLDDEGESAKATKRRFTAAIRSMNIGKQLDWRSKGVPENHVAFLIVDAVVKQPRPKQQQQKASTDGTASSESNGNKARETAGTTA